MPTRQITEIEFGRRALADEAREQLPPEALHADDRRRTTVAIDTSEIDTHTLDRITGMAADAQLIGAQAAGQIPLTQHERNRIDFRRTNVPAARSVKAIFTQEGVEDWTAYFDPSLTVDEHREVARRARMDERGGRMDAHEGEAHEIRQLASAHHTVQREECDHAAEYALDDQDARQFLRNECGWTQTEIQNLLEPGPDIRQPATTAEVQAVDIIRARANGRFMEEPPQPVPGAPGTLRKPSTGRFVGNNFAYPAIGRDPLTGQFVSHGEERPAGPYPGNSFDPDEAMGEDGWSDGQTSLFGERASGQSTFGVDSCHHEPEYENPLGGGGEFIDDIEWGIGETEQDELFEAEEEYYREERQRGLFDW